MSAAFTPGPWTATLDDGDWYVTAYADGHPTIVADIEPMLQRAAVEANAHLIAAAHDLYEALDLFVGEYVELVESGDAGFWNAEDEAKVIRARKALAKARGEQVPA